MFGAREVVVVERGDIEHGNINHVHPLFFATHYSKWWRGDWIWGGLVWWFFEVESLPNEPHAAAVFERFWLGFFVSKLVLPFKIYIFVNFK